MGFDTVIRDGFRGGVADDIAGWEGLKLLLDIDLTAVDANHPLTGTSPDAFETRRGWWQEALGSLLKKGAQGFRFLYPHRSCALLTPILADLHRQFPEAVFIADTPGIAWADLENLATCGFDYCLSSLPWWNGRAVWLAEEYAVLRRVAPIIAMAGIPGQAPPSLEDCRMRLLLAAVTGSGVLMPQSFEAEELKNTIQWMNGLASHDPILAQTGGLRLYPSASKTILLRTAEADSNLAQEAIIAVIGHAANIGDDRTVTADLEEWSDLTPIAGPEGLDGLSPGETRLFRARRAKPIRLAQRILPKRAAETPRIIIDTIMPSVDNGRHASKRLVGETVAVTATIFCDGHPEIAAELLYRAYDEVAWKRTPLQLLGNDRWEAQMPLRRAGRHLFAVSAWLDLYGSFVRDLLKNQKAGKELGPALREGHNLIEAASRRAPLLRDLAAKLPTLPQDEQLAQLIAPKTVEAMQGASERAFQAHSDAFPIDADRKAAGFASWYELFPRSQTLDAARSGTFRDVIAQLPRIEKMGFDVLYLPPIHPIGVTNRKGQNNALSAAPGDVGSPYAIGGREGGHDAIHPALGTLEDFRALVAAAHEHSMEVALDFAVQCSPDHPWLAEHPGWFEWRPDGSIKYAENPPKVYEDIVNVDFYAKDSVPALWIALRDVVMFWVGQGIRIFRVDNPHTKPFAFWEWLIADIRALHPNTLFLAEAFTRPAVMYHLGKIGFGQSYTYFTWRNTKAELTEYIETITKPPVDAFFRPHFFVNTPDINPLYLQHSGRAGFLIRAALAATLSGLWGIFSGFELCEAAPVPGREEYLDSDKYAIRPRDWNAPGNIAAEIAQLNRVRKAEPALQSHLSTTFYNAFNDNILYYGRHPLGYDHHVLVMVNLDPHNEQVTDFEVPLWEWGFADDAVLEVEDLVYGEKFTWHGKMQRIALNPSAPYRIWRIAPPQGATV